jgi:hypothetical protein
MDLPVRREAQQLRSREPLAHDYLAAFVQTYQVKTRLAEINADRVYLHGMPPSFIFYTCSGVKAADHPISYLYLKPLRGGVSVSTSPPIPKWAHSGTPP